MSQSKIKLVMVELRLLNLELVQALKQGTGRSLQASTKTPIPMNLIGTPEQ
ncbi:hypothetical protein FOYG_03417 [Fusarium oxysporum NRRL 32931]|uniref:Uncharacterized protein n=1 Tax=Fusarium oxysporum NRRL 32931 TaxID=660029 RepID=W9J199_FUSOX|nr:hypothetical protein FOYG_03417 [Fusarium oxysporum NRRL 32931]